MSRDSAVAAIVGPAATCTRGLRAGGFDIAGYTWADVAEDIAALPAELHVPRVSVIGFSSGTHAALAFLRAHSDEASRVVLTGIEGPDDTQKLPSEIDRQMNRIGDLVRADSALARVIPDFGALVRQVIDSLNRSPATVVVTRGRGGERLNEPVGGLALAYPTSKSIFGPEEFAALPALYYSLSRGDATLLARFIQRFVNNPTTGRTQLGYMLDGASGRTEERAARIAMEARTALLGDALNFPFPEIRGALGDVDLPETFRSSVTSSVSALFVTGSLDGNTPVTQADAIQTGFPNARRLIIENGGHGSAFTTRNAWPPIFDFLQGKRIEIDTVIAPVPRFVAIPAAR